jgi:hypothetical protein
MVDSSGVRSWSSGEHAAPQEGEREGENRPARILTPRRKSGGGSLQQRSSEVVAATATEERWRSRRHG